VLTLTSPFPSACFSVSGCTDYFAGTEAEAFATGRDVVATFNIAPAGEGSVGEEPAYEPAQLAGIIPAPHRQHTMDMYKVTRHTHRHYALIK
jgi:acetyl-CoA carboxylase carboxyltransferase component